MDIEELRGIELFTGLTDDQLAELATGGDEVPFEPATWCSPRASTPTSGGCCSRGRSTSSARSAARTSWWLGWTCPADGPAASARGTTNGIYLATGRGATPGRVLRLDAPRLRELVNHWFPLAGHLIGGLHHTARSIESTVRQRDALVTLGTLAAGLAHEINNPAAAASRTVDDLGAMLRRAPRGADPAGPRRRHGRASSAHSTSSGAIDRRPRSAGRPGAGRPRERAGHLARGTRRTGRVGARLGPGRRRRSTRLGASGRTTLLGDGALRRAWSGCRPRSRPRPCCRSSRTPYAGSPTSWRRCGPTPRWTGRPRSAIDVRDGLESTLTMLGHKLKGRRDRRARVRPTCRRSTRTPASSTRSGPT